MNDRKQSLRRRRELLVERAAAQRDRVEVLSGQLNEHLWPVDLGIGAARALRRHPWLTAAAGAALVAGGRRFRVLALGARLLALGGLMRGWRLRIPRR